MPELESEDSNQSELTYADQVLNQDSNETKILGLGWNKRNDALSLVTPTFKNNHQYFTIYNIQYTIFYNIQYFIIYNILPSVKYCIERYVSRESRGMNQCPRQLNLSGKNGN